MLTSGSKGNNIQNSVGIGNDKYNISLCWWLWFAKMRMYLINHINPTLIPWRIFTMCIMSIRVRATSPQDMKPEGTKGLIDSKMSWMQIFHKYVQTLILCPHQAIFCQFKEQTSSIFGKFSQIQRTKPPNLSMFRSISRAQKIGLNFYLLRWKPWRQAGSFEYDKH